MSRRPASGGEAALRPRRSSSADDLAAHLGAVSLGSPMAPHSDDEMDIDSNSDTDSVDSGSILAVDPPQPSREERLRAVVQRVAAALPQGTDRLRIDAQIQQTFAKHREFLLPAPPFGEGCARDFLAAARAWRDVADHHAVAAGAAERFGRPDIHATATEAAQFCEAAALRAEMRGRMLQALSTYARGALRPDELSYRQPEITAHALHEVMACAQEQGWQWVPGDSFDQQLQQLAESARTQLNRVASIQDPRHPSVPRDFRVARQLPAWKVRYALAVLDLVDVAESLRAAQARGPRVELGLNEAVAQTRGLIEQVAGGLQSELMAAEAAAGGGLYLLECSAHELAQRAGQLYARVSDAAVLQRLVLPTAAAAVLAQPFALLQKACGAVAQSAKRFGPEEAVALKRAAAAAHEAAAAPGGLAAGQMAALASFCDRLAQDVLSAHAEIEHEATREFLWQSRQASLPAGPRLETMLTDLQGLLCGAAVPAARDEDQALFRQIRSLAADAQARLAAPGLPADAPPRALATERATRLTLCATAAAANAVAESLAVCHQALQVLPQATPRQRLAVVQALAERVRRAGAAVGEALAEQIDFGSAAGLPEHLARVVQEQGLKLRHTERLAERIRVPLQALGLMLEAQRGTQEFRETARTLPPAQVLARISEVGRQFTQAEALLKAGVQRLVTQIQADKAAAERGTAVLLDMETISTMQAFNPLRLRATTERGLAQGRVLVELLQRTLADRDCARRMGRAGLSQLIDQVQQHVRHSAAEIARAMDQPGGAQATRPLQEAAEGLQRELQACRAQMASLTLRTASR
ncbi:MAG TPA: hypothetical protein VFL86_10895 [Burkholderiaceae bacterium]|nr:hypothetical protein [Burkholderiaceae bacterium]